MFDFADLDGASLGQERGDIVLLDLDAAGWGWFVDNTPGNDREFRLDGGVLTASNAQSSGHIDLLSVVAHELGHAAGFGHQDGGVMAATLAVGVRTVMPVASQGGHEASSLYLRESDDSAAKALAGLRAAFDDQPSIDWTSSRRGRDDLGQNGSAPGANWVGDFVNHLGQTEVQRSPNAGLRVLVPVGSRVTHETSALSRT